ncbi:hypothetical protein MtrunA17_Chr2g0315251 [Medicago truncatula]|uniref:Uncharacterized protein n=1 Tax=Medicago truncatula TaxID=3880 RepID=G7IR12_MEDTR|nr:hypothetical protein MTR_2g075480 [Medicago truncatula]RHN74891.1 hypothetical protein MtrunA17_Chr2g0315251 [Medicago truncatula]
MVRQLRSFTLTSLDQVLNSMSSIFRSSFRARGGPRRSELSKGPGPQINSIGTKNEIKGLANNSKN